MMNCDTCFETVKLLIEAGATFIERMDEGPADDEDYGDYCPDCGRFWKALR